MAELASHTRRSSCRNAVDANEDGFNALEARLAGGEDPRRLWEQPLSRTTCEELADLDPAALSAAICLNSEVHPTLAALVGSRALKDAAHSQQGRNAGVAAKLAVHSMALEQLAQALLRCLHPATVRQLLLRGAGDVATQDAHAHFRGRGLLDVAVSLDNKLFLSSAEAQLVLDRAWLGRAVQIVGDDDDDDLVLCMAHKSSVAEVAAGPLARLAAARRERPHLKRWRFVWPVVGAALLPFIALVPLQLLDEVAFATLYSPAERYWTSAVSYMAFVIIIFHLDACEHNCTAGLDLDALLGFWLIALLGVEVQSALQVAASQIEQGRPFLAAIFHLHVFNRWKRLDLVGILVAVAAGATRLASRTMGVQPEASVRAVASLLLWMRLLTVLSVHWATGPLLASLRRMLISDVMRYVVFQVLAIVTHAAAYVALYAGEETVAGTYLGDPLSAVMTLCEQTLPLGDPRSGPLWMVVDASDHKDLGWAITGSFALFSVLLLLNLLIGMLGQSYGKVKAQAEMEYAHGRAREVLHAAALAVVPAPLNLLQIPGATIYFLCSHLFGQDSGEPVLNRRNSGEGSLYGGNAPAAQSIDREERLKLFTRAWEEMDLQNQAADPWRGSVSRQLAQAEKREQQMLERLEAQEALLRRLLDARAVAAPAEAPAEQTAGPTPGRPTVQVSFPRTVTARARMITEF